VSPLNVVTLAHCRRAVLPRRRAGINDKAGFAHVRGSLLACAQRHVHRERPKAAPTTRGSPPAAPCCRGPLGAPTAGTGCACAASVNLLIEKIFCSFSSPELLQHHSACAAVLDAHDEGKPPPRRTLLQRTPWGPDCRNRLRLRSHCQLVERENVLFLC